MLKHLISTQDLDDTQVLALLDRANGFLNQSVQAPNLSHKSVTALFFEHSTRTVASFQTATARLNAHFNAFSVQTSSAKKGESLLDTLYNLQAMGIDLFIIRHHHSSALPYLAKHLDTPLINAGAGAFAHPTQALLDLLTLHNHFKGQLQGKTIVFVGDIKNSRVANSNLALLPRFGLKPLLVAPPHFLPKTAFDHTHDLQEALEVADIVMSLRTQTERHSLQTYGSLQDYAYKYCLKTDMLKKEVVILHPGPVHRNIDIEDALLNDPRCQVLGQVKLGVAVRMALIEALLTQSF
ncbi:aspartate carbamoyltransferase catalytic subunit [Helicobacter ailurogastricus]|uniref:Aspartate carbamoyltransferase n=1 Tax=Helicobacter ailurogastricus TaxID=1578720 RepID=A0A0K2X2M8_9HELI|nr:aspartate carbamoyltransferase catalytic subunit [Helicobacter ailurogastricus]CRF40760.1 Aspartate carbamoyltransferase [Helicobacter ailurogastricus]CRF42466.1 Aspartate carbamoyltransferase [Helicobacter ailurogastricus]CRF43660.1 Aspartate carbamoyltransferase [Helicobacter ailurogastricus]